MKTKLSKFELWIITGFAFVGIVLIHGFLAVSPYTITNGNTGQILLIESAANTYLIIPLIVGYICLVGFIISLIRTYLNH